MNKDVIIIAEAGVNHNGELQLAKKLIEEAALSGADYVKFQTFKAQNVVTKSATKAMYQSKNTDDHDDSQFNMLKKLEIPFDWHKKLIAHASSFGIKFLSTGFDKESIDFLHTLDLDFYKIPSGEITNKPYLKHIASKGIPIVMSTGMANMIEIEEALEIFFINDFKKQDITILHCNTEYPTPIEDVNLKAMNSIKEKFNVNVGYSDHTLGIEVSVAAVALGATVIEKHFTLDKNMKGPDHKASLNPAELKELVKSIRNVQKSISGNGIKEPSKSEQKNIEIVRKSLYYKNNLSEGHILRPEDVLSLRPGNGISPMKIDSYIGKKLNQDVISYSLINKKHFLK